MKCMGRKAQGRPLESRDLGKRLRAGKQPLDEINTLVPSVRYSEVLQTFQYREPMIRPSGEDFLPSCETWKDIWLLFRGIHNAVQSEGLGDYLASYLLLFRWEFARR